MTSSNFKKAGILMVILVSISLLVWERYVRSMGFDHSYNDDGALWSDKRARVYEPAYTSTVFIGSSRIKFDLDIHTWEATTADRVIQLACVGSTPIPVLENLAADEHFKGKLVVDVTEVLFFSGSPQNSSLPEKNIKYYKEETPAQRASFHLNDFLETQLVFLDKDRLSLNAFLAKLHVPNRLGVFEEPIFPPDFGRVKFCRQEYMTDRFLTDTIQRNQVRDIWDFFRRVSKEKPPQGAKLDSILFKVKTAVDKIKARGGQVIFVRTPSSGPFLAGEMMGFPREQYWERLLAVTHCRGIHFADYPALANLVCPEYSHLSQADAVIFTTNFIKILKEDMGWKFQKL